MLAGLFSNLTRFIQLWFGAIFLITACGTQDPVPPSAPNSTKRSIRALILPGGGFSIPVFVGILDELESHGWIPDYIFATCGSTLSTAIYYFHEDMNARLDFLISKEFHQILLSPQSNSDLFDLLKEGWDMIFDPTSNQIPDFFGTSFFKMPPLLRVSTSSNIREWQFQGDGHSKTRIIFIAARTTLSPADIGKKYRKNRNYFEKVIFTDPSTRAVFEENNLHVLFPGDSPRISPTTKIISDWPVTLAIRAAIAEPFLLNPLQIRDGDEIYSYMGSYIDLYPAHYALALADEVIGVYPESPDDPTEGSIRITYGNSPKSQRAKYLSQPLTHWIDLSDRSKQEEASQMRLQYTFSSSNTIRGMGMENRVPTDPEVFNRIVLNQYYFGRSRTEQAIHTSKGSKVHVQRR